MIASSLVVAMRRLQAAPSHGASPRPTAARRARAGCAGSAVRAASILARRRCDQAADRGRSTPPRNHPARPIVTDDDSRLLDNDCLSLRPSKVDGFRWRASLAAGGPARSPRRHPPVAGSYATTSGAGHSTGVWCFRRDLFDGSHFQVVG